ncbi:hypothetical protein [Aeromonas hydrophila]|uniref:hypothetical protein n=1 Tax=Aeromonas hydrophila TaxID=644 RepID=UPI001E31E312|nr:hypothetical protein [Aeromonas hydrophila]
MTLSNKGGIPDNILVTLSVNYPGVMTTKMAVMLPLYDEEKALFYIHPQNWPRIDVVAIPFDPYTEHVTEWSVSNGECMKINRFILAPLCLPDQTIQAEMPSVQDYFAPDQNLITKWLNSVDVTEELFIPGYPKNVQDYYAQPVWKRATIASSVQLGWNREPKFLVDSASKSGMSGAPVFYYNARGIVQVQGHTRSFNQEVAILAGVYVGRLGVDKDEDPQVGTVWNQSVINEIIKGQSFERLSFEIEVSNQELEDNANKALEGSSRAGLENVKNPDLPSRFYVRQRLLERIGGRASPDRALKAVLDAAETYQGPFVADDDELR